MVRRDCGLLMCVSLCSWRRGKIVWEGGLLVTDNSSSLRLRRIRPPTYTSLPQLDPSVTGMGAGISDVWACVSVCDTASWVGVLMSWPVPASDRHPSPEFDGPLCSTKIARRAAPNHRDNAMLVGIDPRTSLTLFHYEPGTRRQISCCRNKSSFEGRGEVSIGHSSWGNAVVLNHPSVSIAGQGPPLLEATGP